MKAIVWTDYGSPDGLHLREVAKPTPKDDDVLIRVHATTVTAGDCEIRTLQIPAEFRLLMRLYMGLLKPRNIILGQELAGTIEAVGKNVTRFHPGDAVFATAGFGFGAYAEYICLPEQAAIALKPANLSYEDAAAVPLAGLEALHFIRQGHIQHGQKVLIYGAGGSIGTFAVQLARSLGADVTGVDKASKWDMLRSIGAEHVIDYTQEDFTTNGQTYDVIMDVVGKSPFSRSLHSLTANGRYLLVSPTLAQKLRGTWVSRRGGKQVISGSAHHTAEDLIFLKGLIEAGTITPIIDRYYPLEQMAEAHRYAETGRKKGNVVITLIPSSTV